MNPGLGQTLADHLAAIRNDWMQRLHREPPATALGRQYTVGFLIDATLTQLLVGVSAGNDGEWLSRCTPLAGPVHSYCACGLPPVQRYFAAGEEALRAVLTPEAGAGIETIVGRLKDLARHEVRSLCQPCPRLGTPVCMLSAAVATAPAS
jgi:hypothetical protein